MNASCLLHHNENVIAQTSGQRLVLFHLETGNYYSLNEMGARIWEICADPKSSEEIVRQIESEYDAPMHVIIEDVGRLLDELKANHLLVFARGDRVATG